MPVEKSIYFMAWQERQAANQMSDNSATVDTRLKKLNLLAGELKKANDQFKI